MSFDVSVKIQQKIVYAKKNMFGILVYVIVILMDIKVLKIKVFLMV